MLGGIRPCTGEVQVHGRAITLRNPTDALRAGIAFVPEDRHRDGIFSQLDVSQNVAISSLRSIATRGFLRRQQIDAVSRPLVQQLGVRAASLTASAGSLSGGNQQKLLVARCLAAEQRCSCFMNQRTAWTSVRLLRFTPFSEPSRRVAAQSSLRQARFESS